MRVLVTIAHHGTKNRRFLLRMIDSFEQMAHDVDVVVVCEEPKNLREEIEQVVGLPTDDPWSLPFAHRRVFVDRANDYDLFVYSEDDTLIEQRHLDSFVEIQSVLPDDLITGFMRYEEYPDGTRSYSTIHSRYRWLPSSACRIGGMVFARFTNDHSACYALTSEQLERAIASGGFVVDPHSGRYDMLVTAATDVYTQCGMTKYTCIDRIEDQLVHHMPNVYLDKLGVAEPSFVSQLEALRALADAGPVREFIVPETATPDAYWDRHCFTNPPRDLMDLFLARPASRVLNIGGTTGDLEVALQGMGHVVSSIPADPVFARVLNGRGVDTIAALSVKGPPMNGPFDYVLAIDALPYLRDPIDVLRTVRRMLANEGRVVVTVPDHRRYWLRNHVPGAKHVPIPAGHAEEGVNRTDPRVIRAWLATAGLDILHLSHRRATRREPFGSGGQGARLRGNVVVGVAAAPR